jgi:hypothetical protein
MVPRRLLKNKTTRGMSQGSLAIYLKKYFNEKEEL